MIKVTFPDGSVREYENGTTGLQIAESISQRLAQDVLSLVSMVKSETSIVLLRRIALSSSSNLMMRRAKRPFGTHLPICSDRQFNRFILMSNPVSVQLLKTDSTMMWIWVILCLRILILLLSKKNDGDCSL